MAGPTRLELATSGVTGDNPNRKHHGISRLRTGMRIGDDAAAGTSRHRPSLPHSLRRADSR